MAAMTQFMQECAMKQAREVPSGSRQLDSFQKGQAQERFALEAAPKFQCRRAYYPDFAPLVQPPPLSLLLAQPSPVSQGQELTLEINFGSTP